MNPEILTVYSTSWCGDCRRAKAFLTRHEVPFHEIDIEQTPGAVETMLQLTGGRQVVPTLHFPDGTIMTEPRNTELATKLGLATQQAA
jgi:mycoredoxin